MILVRFIPQANNIRACLMEYYADFLKLIKHKNYLLSMENGI